MKITATSTLTGKTCTLEINITRDEYSRILRRFSTRELIQAIVPHLTADEREFLISGITPGEWESTFK